MTPEARARAKFAPMLQVALYLVQNRDELNLRADPGVTAREVPTPSAPPANISLFHEKKPSGAFTAARCNDMLPLVVCTIPRGDRAIAC